MCSVHDTVLKSVLYSIYTIIYIYSIFNERKVRRSKYEQHSDGILLELYYFPEVMHDYVFIKEKQKEKWHMI